MVFESALKAKGADYELPPTQGLANAAIIAVFAYLVPLLTMEINYFRLAAYKSWRRLRRSEHTSSNAMKPVFVSTDLQGEEEVPENVELASGEDSDNDCRTAPTAPTAPTVLEEQTCSPGPCEIELGKIDSLVEDFEEDLDADQSVTSSAVGHLVHEVRASLLDTKTNECSHPSYPVLRRANNQIRMASLQSVVSSLIVYSLTATAIGLLTRGIDDKVVAIVVGSSQFIAALLVFIVSTKIPQWFGVYHQGSIRLVKCYSDFSKNFECVDLRDEGVLRRLRMEVRLGVWFHFSKFYIILWPFMCGVQPATIPVSIVLGSLVGFLLMGFVFGAHYWVGGINLRTYHAFTHLFAAHHSCSREIYPLPQLRFVHYHPCSFHNFGARLRARHGVDSIRLAAEHPVQRGHTDCHLLLLLARFADGGPRPVHLAHHWN